MTEREPLGTTRRASYTGLLVLLASTTMIFAAFTSALVVRRGMAEEWTATPKPSLLYVNTGVLLASSAVLEVARRALRAGHRTQFNVLWTVGTVLGLAFLGGQYAVWRDLARHGVYVATSPSSGFFYLLTAAHAVHLLGGAGALVWVDVQALRLRLGPAKRTAVDISALFWHFLDGVWLYLLVLLEVWT